ncbi:TPA: hypothetical protein ME995_003978 [Klebsiella pneumoniae]|nr:hypothetical protein [Klebsiella pneumoniae]
MLLNAADKALWRLALPMIFSNITVPLLGLVDTAVIGHLDSPVYLGGVAVGATATSFLFMLLLFLRMSTTGLTAQAWGAKDPQRLARALVQPLALALGAGVLIILLRLPLIDLALHIVGGSEAVLEQARRFLEIRWLSAPASLANLVLLQLCFGALTVFGARLGSDIVAVNAVLMTMLTFTAYALDGFAYAVEAHSGQAYGARDGSQLLEVWRAACRQSGMVALAFALIYSLAGQYIIALLTSLPSLQQLADRYLIWQTILPVVGVWCYLLDGMFIGATRGAEMRNSMAVAAAGFAVTLLTLPVLGNHGLWLALAVFLALRGLSLALIWRRHWRRGTWFS